MNTHIDLLRPLRLGAGHRRSRVGGLARPRWRNTLRGRCDRLLEWYDGVTSDWLSDLAHTFPPDNAKVADAEATPSKTRKFPDGPLNTKASPPKVDAGQRQKGWPVDISPLSG
jgi:hypothetical protein